MPQLDLTELELKVCWLILDTANQEAVLPKDLWPSWHTAFDKLYRAYRAMPPKAA